MTRRACFAAAVAAAAAAAGCQGGGDFCVLGYSTKPPFDDGIKSVYIPAFKKVAFTTSTYQGIEVAVSEAVVRELGARRSPMHVVSDPARADSELVGTILAVNKGILNRDQLNFTREAELQLTAEVVWRDLRTGRALTNRARPPAPPPVAFDPSLPAAPLPGPDLTPAAVRLTAVGRILYEVGESNASGEKAVVDQLARQIVNMMEKPW